MSGRIVDFCQDSKIVSNNPCRGREEDNTSLKDFNDHHIENTCVVSAIPLELFLLLIFVNNNLFSGRDFVSSSYSTYNFFNSALHLHISPEVIVCIVVIERFLVNILANNNLFNGRDFASSSYSTYNFFNSTLQLHISPEVIFCIVIIERFFSEYF